jgi:hypothetical protein
MVSGATARRAQPSLEEVFLDLVGAADGQW